MLSFVMEPIGECRRGKLHQDLTIIYDDIKPGSIIPYIIKVGLIADVPVTFLEKEGEIHVPHKPELCVNCCKVKFVVIS
jgi:hypothetical protein